MLSASDVEQDAWRMGVNAFLRKPQEGAIAGVGRDETHRKVALGRVLIVGELYGLACLWS